MPQTCLAVLGQRLGLRYIAPVVQADKGAVIPTLTHANPLSGLLKLQLLHEVVDAQH